METLLDKFRDITGFETIKASIHGRLWYIVDMETKQAIGPSFETLILSRAYAVDNYTGQYS